MKKFENSHVFSLGVFPDTVGVDETAPGAKDGSEYVKEGYGEWWGFFQALLDETGVTPSGSTELAGAGLSDVVKAMKILIGGEKIQPIAAVVAANAMTITLSPTYLDFRDATLGSGAVNNRILTAAISLVISSGSTLGTINGIQSRIAVLAIDNAGTVELAAVNIAGGNDLSETGLISTVAEGGAGAADAANVIYSNTLRSNVPYKVVGYIESTQATAGAWATAPSTIQGKGGEAFSGLSSIGYGQTWQLVTGSRAVATTYYNDTGKPIEVAVAIGSTLTGFIIATISGVGVFIGTISNVASAGTATVIIPAGASYSITASAGVPTLTQWSELR